MLGQAMGSLTDWKAETTLADLPPNEKIESWSPGAPAVWTTPRELMREGRLPQFLTLDQVEFAMGRGVTAPRLLAR